MKLRFIAVLLLLAGSAFGQATEGNEKYDQKQYADAANAYEKIPPNQRDVQIYNRLGISYHLSNQLRAAETAYRSALRLEPGNADALNNLAVFYYSQRKFADAERQVRQAIEKSPDSPIMRQNLRAARYARENAKNARDVANNLGRDNPQFVEKRENDLLQMQILMPEKDLQEARLHEIRGDSYFARKIYEEAVGEYQKSVTIDRYNAGTLNRLGLVYQQMQKPNEAERYYREALKQNPYFLEVLNNIGTVEYARQRYESALTSYSRALKIRPDSPTVLLNSAFCLFEMKQYEVAQKALQKALQLDPAVLEKAAGFGTLIQMSRRGDPAVSFYFAKIYASQGNKERAISYLNRTLDEGFTEFEKIKTDPVFAVLAMDEEYKKVLDRIALLTTSNNQTK
jgi:tetratricopeptide (TPR) repeat protein